ncbi:8978_t:CDS:2, partial [Paraglomus occultum]
MNSLSRHCLTNARNSFKYCKTITIRQAVAHRSISTFTASDYVQRFPKFKDIRGPYLRYFLLWTLLGSEALHLRWTRVEHEEYKEKARLQIVKLKEQIAIMDGGGMTQAADSGFAQQTQSLASSEDVDPHK